MLPGAALGEVEHHRLDRVEARRAVAPQVRPVRLAVARLEHRHRRLVGVQHRACSSISAVSASTSGCSSTPHSPTHCASVERAMASPARSKMRFLPVQRQVIEVLGHQHLRQQAGRGHALVDDVRRHRRLHQRLAAGADPLAADVALHREHARACSRASRPRPRRCASSRSRSRRWCSRARGGSRGAAGAPAAAGAWACFLSPCVLLWRLDASSSRLQRRQVGVDRLFEQALLLGAEGLALGGELQPLEHRHLVRELVDDGLLEGRISVIRRWRASRRRTSAQLLVSWSRCAASITGRDRAARLRAVCIDLSAIARALDLQHADDAGLADALPRQAEHERIELLCD